jgi:hypothetical protein
LINERGRLLQTVFGEPFTGNGFGNFMADKIDQAKLHCVTHGVMGHATLMEASRNTKTAAEQKKLAQTAMSRLALRTVIPDSQTSPGGLGKLAKNISRSKGAELVEPRGIEPLTS